MYGKLINEALKAIIDNRNALFKALLIPTMILLVINLLIPKMIIVDNRVIFPNNDEALFIFLIVLSMYVNISMAVSVHRIILIKDDISSLRGIIPTKRELDFFFKSFLVGILLALIFFIVLFFSMILFKIFIEEYSFIFGIALSLLISTIVLSRLSMVFPAISIDDKMGFFDALDFTKNYKFLSLFMVVIFPIILSILITIIYGLLIEFISGVVSSHFEVLYVFLNIFITVLVISCLSVTYSYIKNKINN